ncbi:hypothetical protein SAXI111661_20060 [Saccharomonospora xinjiangensis]
MAAASSSPMWKYAGSNSLAASASSPAWKPAPELSLWPGQRPGSTGAMADRPCASRFQYASGSDAPGNRHDRPTIARSVSRMSGTAAPCAATGSVVAGWPAFPILSGCPASPAFPTSPAFSLYAGLPSLIEFPLAPGFPVAAALSPTLATTVGAGAIAAATGRASPNSARTTSGNVAASQSPNPAAVGCSIRMDGSSSTPRREAAVRVSSTSVIESVP